MPHALSEPLRRGLQKSPMPAASGPAGGAFGDRNRRRRSTVAAQFYQVGYESLFPCSLDSYLSRSVQFNRLLKIRHRRITLERCSQRLFQRTEPGFVVSPLIQPLAEDGPPYLFRTRGAPRPLVLVKP